MYLWTVYDPWLFIEDILYNFVGLLYICCINQYASHILVIFNSELLPYTWTFTWKNLYIQGAKC